MASITKTFSLDPNMEMEKLRLPPGKARINSLVLDELKLKRKSAVMLQVRGKKIVREALGGRNIPSETMCLDCDSCCALGIEFKGESEIEIGNACSSFLYWNHPEHSLRLSFRLGVLGVLPGAVGAVGPALGVIFALCGCR